MRITQITKIETLETAGPIQRSSKPADRSSTYQFVDTKTLISQVESRGWKFNRGQVSRAASDTGAHLLVFRNPSLDVVDLGPATSIPELIIYNSHDGTSAIRFLLGLFRMACLNGILSGLSMKQFRAQHSANGVARIAEGVDFVTSQASEELQRVKELSQIQLSESQRSAFIHLCIQKRLSSVRGEVLNVARYSPRRIEDLGADAYTTLNRGQELLMRGGFHYTTQTIKEIDGVETIARRNHTARPIYSVSQSVALNRFAVETMDQLLKESVR